MINVNSEHPDQSITAVDFPIHDYIAAIFMKLTGIGSPWIFRLYILFYSFFGLYCLVRLAHFLSGNFYKALFALIFAATSPVFVYYQGGFLPTIPSLANATAGILFYSFYLKNSGKRHFNLAILFLTLAALSRTTFLIPLLALLGTEFIRFFRNKVHIGPKVVPVLSSLMALLAYYLYNEYLRNHYGSIFLNYFLPPGSLSNLIEIVKGIKANWTFQYFSAYHYIILILLLGIAAYHGFVRKETSEKPSTDLILFLAVYLFGCLLFAYLMLQQFTDHDYYFLDTFYLPVIIVLIFLLQMIKSGGINKLKLWQPVLIASVSVVLIINAYRMQENRHISGHWDRTMATITNFEDSESFLDSLGISDSSRILVIDSYTPNIPFILMNRKGFPVMTTGKENIISALNWDFDYIITQNEFFYSDVYSNYPEILSRLDKIADNGKITLSKLSTITNQQTLFGFLGIENKIPALRITNNFDSLSDERWQNVLHSMEDSFSGSGSCIVKPDMYYGLTCRLPAFQVSRSNKNILVINSQFKVSKLKECELVVVLNKHGENAFYTSYNLVKILESSHEWQHLRLICQLPKLKPEIYELAIYIVNAGGNRIYIDDIDIALY